MENKINNGLTRESTKPNVYPQFNGVGSSHSSRSSTPARLVQIPSSQLPPSRFSIPQSQLPPDINPDISSKFNQLSVSSLEPHNISLKNATSTPTVPFTDKSPQRLFTTQNISPVPKNDVVKASTPIPNVPSALQQSSTSLPLIPNSQKVSYASPIISNSSEPRNATPSYQNVTNSATMQYPQNSVQQPQQYQQQPTKIMPTLPPKINENVAQQPQYNLMPQQGNIATQQGNIVTQQSNIATPQQYNNLEQSRPNIHANRYPQQQPQQNVPQQHFQQQQINQQQQFQQQHLNQQQFHQQQINRQQFQQQQINQQQLNQQQLNQQQLNQQQLNQQQFQQQRLNQQQFQQQPLNQQQFQRGQQGPYESIATTGFSKYWGTENYDLLQNPNILPPTKIEPPKISLGNEILNEVNCSSEIIRCTITKIPENNSILQKSRLPLGILIHPFKDLTHLNVVSCSVIVRCRSCRTYINPFVYFVDNKRWKCNLCYRVNELPEEFLYDPYTKSYGDPSRRPEIKTSTIEYIAPAEYMLRPPQPAVYLYLLDISRLAVESGYLNLFCQILMDELNDIPGDARTQIGFIAYDSALHFYSMAEGQNQPHEMIVLDIDDIFVPTTDNLLVNLKDRFELVNYLLQELPKRYSQTFDNNSALGAALQVAYKLMSATGGRVTVFQASLPNVGPGALASREDPSQRANPTEVAHLNPANDFYKRLALECNSQQIAVDLFIVNSQYVDIATISGISRFSGGCIHHLPLFKASKVSQAAEFERSLRRYLSRKIGFEAVMRIRCTRGLAIHTFHGNFFVRSTDLLSLPNINPDVGFGMQVAIEENLSDVQSVCFQAALLYTSSKGERRIRVHTICLPVVATVHDVIHSADQQAIVGLLSKMAVDRSMQSSLSDAREAFINVAVDILSSYKLTLNMGSPVSGLLAPNCLRVLPLYISALLKNIAFKTGTAIRVDDRVKAMIDMKTKPLCQLIRMIYPDLYPIHNLENDEVVLNAEEEEVPLPPRLQLTSRCLDSKGAFLLDMGEKMIILVCPNVSDIFLKETLGVPDYASITDNMYEIPTLNNVCNQRLQQFVAYLNDDRPFPATIQIIRDNSNLRVMFFEKLIEDRTDNALSYHEFLQHLKSQIK